MLLALVGDTMLFGNCKTSQVCSQYLDFSPFFQTPAVSPRSRINERFLLAATNMRVSPTALLVLTTLNRFKLSPYGSKSFLPTLNTHLTALCPRLDTDSLLWFIGSGVSPDYIDCTELAHHITTSKQFNHLSIQIVPDPPDTKNVSPTIISPMLLTIATAIFAISSGVHILPVGLPSQVILSFVI